MDDFTSKPCNKHCNICVKQMVARLLHSFSRADSYSRCQTGYVETKALERCHGPTSVSPSRAAKLLHTRPAGRPVAGAGGGGSSAPSGDWCASPASERQSYCTKLFATVGIAHGHLKILLLMIHPAKERILKADNYTSLEPWNLQALLLLLLFSST